MEIEKNIPMPVRNIKTIEKMKVGDSLFFTSFKEMMSHRSSFLYRKFKPSLRKVKGGWRLWRVK